MKTVQDKAEIWLDQYFVVWNKSHFRSLVLLLKEQDRDTRHACAEAVLQMDEPLSTTSAGLIAHDICMNTRAV